MERTNRITRCVGCRKLIKELPGPEQICGHEYCEAVVKNNLRSDLGMPPLPLPSPPRDLDAMEE